MIERNLKTWGGEMDRSMRIDKCHERETNDEFAQRIWLWRFVIAERSKFPFCRIRMNFVQEMQRYRSLDTAIQMSDCRRADDRLWPHLKEPSWKELARFFPSRVTYAEISSYLLYKCVYHRATVCSYLSRCAAKDRIRMPIHLQNEEIFV